MRRGAAERFTVPFEGRPVHFRRQNASQRLSHRQRACAMMPRLGKRGLGGEEAYALAYNCVLLRQTLDGPDRLRTLGQIAGLCRLYWAQGDLPFGGAEEDSFDREEYSFNESFPEEEFPC